MGFYSPSQLIQDAKRHGVSIRPVNINRSFYENTLEPNENNQQTIRLSFIQVNSLKTESAKSIELLRG